MEFATDEKYGGVFDAARPSLKIANLEGVGGDGAVSREAERKRRIHEMKAKVSLSALDALVQAHVRRPRAIPTLRLVVSEGRCVAYFSKGPAGRSTRRGAGGAGD